MDKNKRGTVSDLKIIALKPGTGCRSEYLKVLKADRLYTLYNDYKFDDTTDKITYHPSVPEGLFSQDGLRINVSAIAGQNGAGKSSLIELMFMAINNIAVKNELNPDLVTVIGIDLELYCFVGHLYKIRVRDDEVQVFKYTGTKNSLEKTTYHISDVPLPSYDLNGFFFTIAINYSLYAYNSLEIPKGQKDWLKGLFYKNDSYQTPLVINPWRDKGNINVNRENALVRLRLMANLLRTQKGGFTFRKPTDNLYAVKLRLKVNREKSRQVLYEIKDGKGKPTDVRLKDLEKIDKHDILKRLNKIYSFKYSKLQASQKEVVATDYLIGKLVTIAVTYDEYVSEEYFKISEGNFDTGKLDRFLRQVIDDPSHIAFKVKQTLNFFRYSHVPYRNSDISIEQLANEIGKIRKNKTIKYKIEELLPPPIFRVDILLSTNPSASAQNKDLISFETLSSGERQFIYSISSVLYHLINIDSVRRYREKKKYDFVNIVFEEVELYFHPEMQRCYVKNLLDSIRNIQLQSIKGINICFVTHSPFILSDIPDANVMFLKVIDKESQLAAREEKTFGANIHDLLADGFFMYNGLCGEFATQKINGTIAFLEYQRRLKVFQLKSASHTANLSKSAITTLSAEDLKTEEAALAKLREEMGDISEDKNDHYRLIKSIGEPVIAIKLLEMYDELFASDRREVLEARIKEMQDELANLKS